MQVSHLENVREILLANNENYLANAVLASEIQKNSHDYQKILNLGLGYLQTKTFEPAQTCFRELVRLTQSFEGYYFLAKSQEALGYFEAAKENYLDAILIPTTRYADLFDAFKNLGNLYLREKNFELAEDFYLKAFALQPDSAQLFVNLGTLEMQKENISLSIERYRKALTLDTKFAPGWIGLALSYAQFGDFEMAWASLLKAVDLDPNNTTALHLMAQWSTKNQSQDSALEALMKYFDQGGFDTTLSLCFIELCITMDRFRWARWELERSLLWDPENTQLLQFDRALKNHGY